MKSAIKNILFPVISAILLIVVEKVIEKLMEDTGNEEKRPTGAKGGPGSLSTNH